MGYFTLSSALLPSPFFVHVPIYCVSFHSQATISESTLVSGADNVITILLAVDPNEAVNLATESIAGLPAGQILITGLYWPQNWPDASNDLKKIPVVGYRSEGFGLWDGTSLRLNVTSRPQVGRNVEPVLSSVLLLPKSTESEFLFRNRLTQLQWRSAS